MLTPELVIRKTGPGVHDWDIKTTAGEALPPMTKVVITLEPAEQPVVEVEFLGIGEFEATCTAAYKLADADFLVADLERMRGERDAALDVLKTARERLRKTREHNQELAKRAVNSESLMKERDQARLDAARARVSNGELIQQVDKLAARATKTAHELADARECADALANRVQHVRTEAEKAQEALRTDLWHAKRDLAHMTEAYNVVINQNEAQPALSWASFYDEQARRRYAEARAERAEIELKTIQGKIDDVVAAVNNLAPAEVQEIKFSVDTTDLTERLQKLRAGFEMARDLINNNGARAMQRRAS